MTYCTNCGEKLIEGARFCGACGSVIGDADRSTRRTVYEGELHKCPSCGEVLNAFVPLCPACGYELRGSKTSSSVSEFARKLEQALTEHQTITLIKSFPIPNTKEDIYEYIIIASSNITSDSNAEIFDAWKVKFEQSYQKAKLLLKNDPSLSEMQTLYDQTRKRIYKIESSRKVKTIVLTAPEIIVSSIWIISIFILIHAFKVALMWDQGKYLAILLIDYLAGMIILPIMVSSKFILSKAVLSIGLMLSQIWLIVLYNDALMCDQEKYLEILVANAIALVAIMIRTFRSRKTRRRGKCE